jgi:Fe-S cluster assembly protein SufB
MGALLQILVNQPDNHGFVTNIESDVAPKGLNENTIRMISVKKKEPAWLLDFRLKSQEAWFQMKGPKWPKVRDPKIDF